MSYILPPLRGISGGNGDGDGSSTTADTASIASAQTSTTAATTTSSSKPKRDPVKEMWLETQWTNLSMQAKRLGLSKLPYFDPATMLLSKEVNVKLWKQMAKLYNVLGPEKAPYACPLMVEGGEVKWHSFVDEYKGDEVDIFHR